MSASEIKSCEEALQLLAAYLDRELDAATRARLDQHLETCRSCYSRSEFEKQLKAKVVALGREPVSPTLAARVRGMIHRFATADVERLP